MSEHNQIGGQQEQLLRVVIDAATFDLDDFIETVEQAGAAQAIGSGDDLRFARNAAEWAEIARLLKPFRDEVIRRLDMIIAEDATLSDRLKAIEEVEDMINPLAGKVVAGQEITRVADEDEVVCECYDRECTCNGSCRRPALYSWGQEEDGDYQFLCRACCLRLIERGFMPDFKAEEAKDALAHDAKEDTGE